MARILTLYTAAKTEFRPIDMSVIRWLKISEALAQCGHEVDIATNEPGLTAPLTMSANLRRVPLSAVRWPAYDVVKTLFHIGFETLEAYGGDRHPFVIAKLGSVAAETDRPDVYFFGDERRQLYEIQTRIERRCRYVTLLTAESIRIWRECFGENQNLLLVPGAADRELPAAGPDPFPPAPGHRCLFAGNIYDEWYQAEVHRLLVDKLNRLGGSLANRGVQLFFLGRGETSRLDPASVISLGAVPHDRCWDYMRFADVGIVLAFGSQCNVNESTKIYHYLRSGLPTVCESGFPNEGLIQEAGLGYVTPAGDLDEMANQVHRACERKWDTERAVNLVLSSHTWDARASVYDRILREQLAR